MAIEHRGSTPASSRPNTDVFELLSDGTRLRIVQELFTMDESTIAFSTLAKRIGADDGGRFNYHLSRLRGSLVEKDQSGYRLTADGRAIAETVLVIEQP